MREKTLRTILTSFACCLLAVNCGQDDCVTGRQIACVCDNGAEGAQVCSSDGTYDRCSCAGSVPDGSQRRPEPDGGTITTPNGPKFLTIGADVAALTEGETVVFTAVVTDGDGIDDLIGGSLVSSDGRAHYGAFATSGQEGAYSLVLSWGKINQVQPISFLSESVRSFKVEFFDQAGHVASQVLSLRLHCDGVGCCNGRCTDLSTDAAHCGACDHRCDALPVQHLGQSLCVDATCVFVSADDVPAETSCDQYCAPITTGGLHYSCANACDGGLVRVGGTTAARHTYNCRPGSFSCSPPQKQWGTEDCQAVPPAFLSTTQTFPPPAKTSYWDHATGRCCCGASP